MSETESNRHGPSVKPEQIAIACAIGLLALLIGCALAMFIFGPPPPSQPSASLLNAEAKYLLAYDNISQRWMAISAVFVALLTVFMTGLSASGVYLLYETLRATHTMAGEADRASRAAWQTVELTETVGAAQAQAYIDATEFEVFLSRDPGGPILAESLRITLRNSGSTPATQCQVGWVMREMRSMADLRAQRPNFTVPAVAADAPNLASGEPVVVVLSNVPQPIQIGSVILVWGQTFYRTMFGKFHKTQFCFALASDQLPRPPSPAFVDMDFGERRWVSMQPAHQTILRSYVDAELSGDGRPSLNSP